MWASTTRSALTPAVASASSTSQAVDPNSRCTITGTPVAAAAAPTAASTRRSNGSIRQYPTPALSMPARTGSPAGPSAGSTAFGPVGRGQPVGDVRGEAPLEVVLADLAAASAPSGSARAGARR